MKKAHRIIRSLLVGMNAIAWTALIAEAQPSGTIATNVANATNQVWDLAAAITNISFGVVLRNGSSVEVAYPVMVSQSGGGVLSGTAPNPAVTLTSNSVPLTFSQGKYTVSGTLTSSKGKGHALVKATLTGFETLSGASSRVTAIQMRNLRFDNTSLTVTGTVTGAISIPGTGSATASSAVQDSLTNVVAGDGSWNISMDVSTAGKVVSGTGTVVLNSGLPFHYRVHGSYSSATGLSKLTLTAADQPTRGSALQLVLSGNTIVSIRGAISGQQVNVVLGYAPSSLAGYAATVRVAGKPQGLAWTWGDSTWAQTGLGGDMNENDYTAGSYTYLRTGPNTAVITNMDVGMMQDWGDLSIRIANLTFTGPSTATGEWSGGPGGAGTGTMTFSRLSSLVPASAVGKTLEARGTRIPLAGDGTFAEMKSGSVAGTGTYSFTPYSPTVAILQLNWTDSDNAGAVAYVELTFKTATDVNIAQSWYAGPAIGSNPDDWGLAAGTLK